MFIWAALLGHFLYGQKIVPLADIKAGADGAVQQAKADLHTIAEAAQRGELSGAQWLEQSQEALKRLYLAEEALAVGGWEQLALHNLQSVSEALTEEFTLQRAFAEQINAGQVRVQTAGFLKRSAQYADRARAHYENTRLDDNGLKRGHTEFRRILGRADHCKPSGRPSCEQAAAMGWQPKKTFIRIGKCTCDGGCHCVAMSRVAK